MVATKKGLADLYTLHTARLRRAKMTSSLEEKIAVLLLTFNWLVADHRDSI